MDSTGARPWQINPSDEDPVRPRGAETSATDATEPGSSGESRRKDKRGEDEDKLEGRSKSSEDKKKGNAAAGGSDDDIGIRRRNLGRVPRAPTKKDME